MHRALFYRKEHFYVKYRLLENLFTQVIIQWSSWNPQEKCERLPVVQHVEKSLSHTRVGFNLLFIKLLIQSGFEFLH